MSLPDSGLRHAGAGHALQPSSCLRLTGSCLLGITYACSMPLRSGTPALSNTPPKEIYHPAIQLL